MSNDQQKGAKEQCIRLLMELKIQRMTKKKIAETCVEKSLSLGEYDVSTITSYFTRVNDKDFKFSPEFPTAELISTLIQILGEQPITQNKYNGTIIFSYWSEGSTEHKDSDVLKTAFIRINLDDLDSIVDNTCELFYIKNHEKKEPIEGWFRKKSTGEGVLIFNFDNGTSLLMYLHDHKDFVGKFYKGTYIATPGTSGSYIAAGIAIFQVQEKPISEFINYVRDETEKEIIESELYKKRFLLNNTVYHDVFSLKTYDTYKELKRFNKYYIRYRKSASTKKIHGDLINIEPNGRVSYKGMEPTIINGRCFIQKTHDDEKAKNLIIELYQEADSNKQGFEFRNPHSFMMFDIRNHSAVIEGYLLKPKNEYFPHSEICYLIELTDDNLNEESFQPSKFEFELTVAEQLFENIKNYHEESNKHLIIQAFHILLKGLN